MNQQDLLQFAIRGLEVERERIDGLLADLKAQLRGVPAAITGSKAKAKARAMSAQGRANIRAALKRRWQAFHEKKGGTKPVVKKKRVLSKAQLEAMRKNAAKARAAALKKAADTK